MLLAGDPSAGLGVPKSVGERLKDGVGGVFVKLDAYLGPQIIRQIVELAAR
jgi:hypothetical protein